MEEDIRAFEAILNESTQIIEELERVLDQFEANRSQYQKLKDFYGSEAYFKAVELLNQTDQFSDIPCGVLSEDAVFNLIGDHYASSIRMLELAMTYLKEH
ncbi:DUF4298 domain-containing protein [Streptococcus gallinaceus]|uniref:DUF4298 domain-containing protein n=1 Tax=Streptococcus gallinaceus TaxID=165758 RepID=A0ABV2JI16_9STRE|nr:DUF4298 domain-containing protein [Streptococcus gallinaceus]MCP1638417.1 hypothetical protein [Streptococcus gallinaceus]MCP1769496.1 hypothetical protein [Streptococcus gallinaceus]